MSRSRTYRIAVLVPAILAVLALAPAGAAAQEENQPPVISNTLLSPGILTYLGGEVQISADIVDDVGVGTVFADVAGPGNSFSVTMERGDGDNFRGNTLIPPNFSPDGIGYQVTIWASDGQGGEASAYPGEIFVGPEPQFDEAPIVSNVQVTPRSLPAAGGAVTIRAAAYDTRSVSEVYATIFLPGGGSELVPMPGVNSAEYEGTFNAPPNTGSTPLEYAVQVTALDDIGQPGNADGGVITVAAKPSPRLGLLPANAYFGDVKVGRSKLQVVKIAYWGPRKGAPIKFVVREPAGPFHLRWPLGRYRTITLGPGGTATLLVEFKPRTPGWYKKTLAVERKDGGQSGLAITLWGHGVAR